MKSRLFSLILVISLGWTSPFCHAEDPTFNGRTLSEWTAILKDDPLVRKRRAALISLGQMIPNDADAQKKAVPVIAKALKADSNPGIRAQVAVLLGTLPDEAAPLFIGDLAEALRAEKDSTVRKELATAVGRLGRLSSSAVLPLMDVLKDDNSTTRAAAATALGRIGKEARRSAGSLFALVNDKDREVRRAAIFAVGRVDPDDMETAANLLVQALEKEFAKIAKPENGPRDVEMISEIIVSLGLLGEKTTAVVQAVARHMVAPEVELRRLSSRTLRQFGAMNRAASAEIMKAFESDEDKTVRANALHALALSYSMDPKPIIPALCVRLKKDPDFEVRIAIAEVLGSFGANGKDAIPALREARRDSQLKVRQAAALAIRNIEKPPEKPMEDKKPE